MQSTPFLFSVLAASLFAALLTTTSRAHAQSIGVASEQSLPRLDARGQPVAKRALTLTPEGINAQDCLDDQRIRFAVQMTGFQANATVQVWASTRGVDCSASFNRTSAEAQCWSLAPAVPLQPTVDVDVPVRAILAPAADASVCGAVDLTEIDVQFLMFEPGNLSAPAVSKTITIAADTIGPRPPRLQTLTPGNGRARVDVAATDPFVELDAFCERSTSNECAPSALVAGGAPDPARACGTVVGANASSLFAAPIENGTTSVVAVAARDAFGNLGPLSNVGCTIPSADAEPSSSDAENSGGGCAIARSHRDRASDASAATALFALCIAFAARKLSSKSRALACTEGRKAGAPRT